MWLDFGIQSDLGHPATSGPSPIQISDLSGYGSYMLKQSKLSRVYPSYKFMHLHIANVSVTNYEIKAEFTLFLFLARFDVEMNVKIDSIQCKIAAG